MKVAIAGGHGQIALHLTRQLHDAGHEVLGLVRNPEHEDDLREAGAEPVVIDLESTTATLLTEAIAGSDAVVFAAGAGGDSGAARKLSLDRDGAVLLADAAQLGGVMRYVIVSSMGAGEGDLDSDDVFGVYLAAKGAADDAVRASALDWTVVKPGHLTNEPGTGSVRVGDSVGRGSVPREDVAAVLLAVLFDADTIGTTFELVSGDDPIATALAGL